MPVPSSACLVESSRSTLFFLLFPFGRYGGAIGGASRRATIQERPYPCTGCVRASRRVFRQVELHGAPATSHKGKFLAAATSKPSRRLSGSRERFRLVGCFSLRW